MGLPRAKAFIEQAGQAGIRRIVFNGGEPLVHPRDMGILIQHAAEEGMMSALITNGSWASTRMQAKRILSDLKETGLRSITLSTDRYHLLKVPLENLDNALQAAKEIGLQIAVKVARLPHDPVAEGLCRSLRKHSTTILVQEISPLGRGASLRWALSMKPASSFSRPGCMTPPVLLPDGNLLTCCNLPARDMRQSDYPFILGNAEEESLDSLLTKHARDPVLTALRSTGPSTLLALLARMERRFTHLAHHRFHSGCDLCFYTFCKLPDKRVLYSALEEESNQQNGRLGDSA